MALIIIVSAFTWLTVDYVKTLNRMYERKRLLKEHFKRKENSWKNYSN
nr:MAG TPA: hypothetical protein [Caudoviricetes sp.]